MERSAVGILVTLSFIATFIGMTLLCGWLADTFGAETMLMTGAAILAVAAIIACCVTR